MKTLLAVLALIPAALFAAAAPAPAVDPSKPIPVITLPDGRVLRDVTFSSHKAETVLAKHRGGSVALRYEAIPHEFRIEAEKKRPGGSRYYAGDVEAAANTYSGQVFVQTQGAGAYKFGATTVYAFDLALLSRWDTRVSPIELPEPISQAVTDADGRFLLRVPPNRPFFIFCQVRRYITEWSYYEWRLTHDKIKEKDKVMLSNDEMIIGWSTVRIQAVQ